MTRTRWIRLLAGSAHVTFVSHVTFVALTAFAALVALAGAATPSLAQSWPDRPVKLIVPYPPGGNNDLVARIYGEKLSAALGQPVVIENRGGAAGSIGAAAAAKSPADGYTLLIGDLSTLVINRYALPNPGYEAAKDFAPVATIAAVSIVMTGRPDLQANNIAEFLALARANPGKLTVATGGNGSIGHLALEVLASMTKIQVNHVPYKGGGPAVTDLLGGHVDALIDGAAYAQVKAGKLKALGMTGDRIASLPGVPSISEAVPGYRFTNWWGILVPAGTDVKIIERLSNELTKIAASPEIREKLTASGVIAWGNPAAFFADHIREENDKIAKIVKSAGVKFQ